MTLAGKKEKIVRALLRWGAFLGIAAAALCSTALPFWIRGNSFAWAGTGTYRDGVTQHLTFLEYMYRHGIFGGVGGYDYNVGLGADYITSFSYYMLFDPVNLLLFILPTGNFSAAYSVLICVKLLIAAVCMFVYLGAHGVRQSLRVLFSVAYMLSGYMLYSFVRHPDLTAGAMYLPLVALGIERVVQKREPFLLMISVFVITIGSFYMAYMVTLYAIAYAALYYVYAMRGRGEPITAKKFFAVFFRTAGAYAAGLSAASFVLLPVAYGYMHGARSAGKGIALYSTRDLLSFVGGFFVPIAGNKYTAVMFNAFTLALCAAAVTVMRQNAHRTLSVVLAAGIFVPLFGYAMNLFNYAGNRFVYMLSFGVYALLAEYLQARVDTPLTEKERGAMLRGLAAAIAVLINVAVWAGIGELIGKAHPAAIAALVVAAVGLLCGSVYGVYRLRRVRRAFGNRGQKLSLKGLAVAFAAVTLAGAVAYMAVYSAEFDNGTQYKALQSEAEAYVAAQTDEFVRLDQFVSGYGDIANRPLNNGYKGTLSYNTMSPGALQDFLSQNGVYVNTHGMSGLNGRSALQAVLAAAYYRAPSGTYVPTQYMPTETADLYKTEAYLRFGTVLPAMSQAQWLQLPVAERQYALLRYAVTETADEAPYTPIGKERDLASEAFVLQSGEQRTFSVTPYEGERYLQFAVADLPAKDTLFRVSCGRTALDMLSVPRGKQMYTGQKTFLYKLDEAGTEICVRNVSGAALTFTDLSLYEAPLSALTEHLVAGAALPHLEQTEFSKNAFGGTVQSDGGEMLIPLTHSAGWHAQIDGEETTVRKADGGLMSVSVPAGTHTVTFSYTAPLWQPGKILSCMTGAGILVFAGVYIGVRAVKKTKKPRNFDKNHLTL